MTGSDRTKTQYGVWTAALALCLALVGGAVSSAEVAERTDGVRTIYLIRHGEYDHVDERDPDVGKALVPLGVAQAKIVGARLRGLPVEMTSLHSSTMTRARQTALVIGEEFPDLELKTSRLIRECTPPTRREDIMAEEEEVDLEACTAQLEDAFPVFFTPSPDADRHDVIVCHGNVIRYFVTKVLQVDTMAWLGMSIGNCSMTVVKINADGSMKLLSFGDVGHLPPNLSTRTTPGEPIDLNVPETDLTTESTTENLEIPAKPALLEYFERGGQAIERDDWTGARDAYLAAIELEPNVPVLHFYAGRVEAHLGNADASRSHLEAALALGATTDLTTDEAYDRFLELPEFQELARQLSANGEPAAAAEIVHRFSDTELWPEGIAVDQKTGDLYVGSIRRRSIYRVGPDGTAEELGQSSEDDLKEVLGMWVDSERRTLWAATGEGAFEGPVDHQPRTCELIRYDLETGRLDGRYPVPNDEIRLLNDVVVGPDGTAWATETTRGELFRVAPGGELELWRRYPELIYLNGIAISGDGTTLYLGHYGGLSAVSVDDGSIQAVRGEDMALGMVDGLSWVDNRLILVQNSRHVNFRVVRVDLGPRGRVAETLEVLPSGLPEGLIPYTSAVHDGTVFVVAGAPFEIMDEGKEPAAPAVVRFPLEP